MNKFFAILGGCIVVILTALFTVPAVIDWSRYRAAFEEQATRLLGRPVRVGEHVRVQLLPSPFVSFENVRIADASGHFDTPLLRAESFHMQLAIGALLTGSLVAQDIDMTSPSLRLAIGPDGKGNWAGLGAILGGSVASDLPGLALNAVHIEHGSLELVEAGGLHTHIDNISGDFDAPGLKGPYHFRGEAAIAGQPAEVRLSAGNEGTDATTRVRVAWHELAAQSANYTLDGTIEGIEAVPHFAGSLSAQSPKAPGSGGAAVGAQLPFELKAGIDVVPERAKLHDVELVFDDGSRPQRLTGTALFDWRDASASVADLSAVWLDLDKIAGVAPAAGPLASFRTLAERMIGASAMPGLTHLRLQVGEFTVGGGSVRDLRLDARRTTDGLAVDSLSGQLPGLSRLELSGTVGNSAEGSFAGSVRLWGENLAQLANWAVPGAALPDKGATSPYLIDGSIAAEPAKFRADNLRLEISGTSVTGSLSYSGTEPRSMFLTLDSGRLDVTQLLDAPFAGSVLAALIAPPAPQGGKAPAEDLFAGLRTMLSGETHLDLRIGHLIMAQGALRDVSARFDRTKGRLDIPAIDLSTEGGSSLHIEGALQSKGDAGLGQLRLTLAVPSADAVAETAKLVGAPELSQTAKAAAAAMTPLRLAGTVQLGGSAGARERLQLDGLAHGSRAVLSVVREGTDNDWLGSPLDLSAELANPDASKLIAQLASALGSTAVPAPALAAAGAAVQPGLLTVRLSGVPRESLLTSVALLGQPLHARFDGRAALGDSGLGLDGAVNLEATDGAPVLALARLDSRLPPLAGPVTLAARVKRDGTSLSLTEARATFAGQTLTGSARLDTGKQPAEVTADVSATAFQLDQILTRPAPGEQPPSAGQLATTQAAPAQAAPAWSSRPIDFAALDGFQSKVEASASRLVLPDGTLVSNARFSLATTPASLDVTVSGGSVAGGTIAGHGRLAKEAAGVVLQADGKVADAALDGLAGAGTGLPQPQGRLGLAGHLESHGLSPADLAAGATGAGEFTVGEGGIAGMSPLTIDTVARAILADPTPVVAEADLKLRLDKARTTARFPTLGAHGGFVIGDGSIRFDGLLVKSSKSELEISNRIDLAAMRLASTWTLKPKSPQADAPSLAPVQFAFDGPLRGFATVPAGVDAAALARDLTNRKLLGAPEQMMGIWPESTPSPALPPAVSDAKPPAVPPRASTPATAAANAHARATPSDAAFVVTEPPPASVPTGLDTSTTASSLVGTPQAVAPAAAPNTAAGAGDSHARRKKSDWAAALFQSLFGN